jgi:leucyl aminopeptidase
MRKLILLVATVMAWTTKAQTVDVTFSNEPGRVVDQKVFFVTEAQTKNFPEVLESYNKASDGYIKDVMMYKEFTGKKGQTLSLDLVAGTEQILLMGVTQDKPLSRVDLQNLGGKIAKELDATGQNVNATILVQGLNTRERSAAAHIAYGYHLRAYHFDKYKSEQKKLISRLTLVTDNVEANQTIYNNDLAHLATGVHMARDFAWEPGKSVYPAEFVKRVRERFAGIKNISIDVLDVKRMERLDMGAILGVGQGSVHEPKLLVIEYKGGNTGSAPIVLAGKGITFDTGGTSIKPNNGMWAMKSDLSGAAAVAGTLYALAQRGERANVVGVMPLAENMPDGTAIRPGDVLETMKGTSIEIISTDAEGRLILADAVYYAQQTYKPKMLLNIATLTGSAARALSDEYAALITRNFDYSTEIMKIGETSGEHVWPLPLHPNHFDQLKSDIADIKNSGVGNPGASIGAAVIGTFVDEALPWVHLDIAGVDWLDAATDTAPKGAHGWGVRFMDQLVRDYK